MSAPHPLPADYASAALQAGLPGPLGATWTGAGVNFAVYASGASRVDLCLFGHRASSRSVFGL